MQGTRFEPQSSHLSTLRVEFLAARLDDKKKHAVIKLSTRRKTKKHLEQRKFPKINNKIYNTSIYQQIEKFAYPNKRPQIMKTK
jgi:hypothetical protein